MTLHPGARLGPYEVLSALGAGGMGEVWRARDTRLDREVALKVLPEAFVADPDRLARFEREAKVLASLNHPHIGGIHGLEEADGVKALVLELVEGPTLADRIARGPVPIDDTLAIARQIAAALEAAHELGVVHRDLKPANIKVRPDGTVKVLDFGLAKMFEARSLAADLSQSPTLTSPATQMGVVLGTAAYMAPEQARGEPADRRSDIWSFGVIVFEMMTGNRLFAGATVSDTIAAVLRAEIDWAALPAETPWSLRRVLRHSLERDRRRRLQHIGDARLEIEDWATEAPVTREHESKHRRRSLGQRLGVVAVALASAIAAGALLQRWITSSGDRDRSPTRQGPVRVSVSLPHSLELLERPNVFSPSIALSPDGTILAMVGEWHGEPEPKLFLRALNGFDLEPVPGTEGATTPFFSPDGQWVGFHARGKLKKVPTAGGAVVTICEAPLFRGTGIDWGPDGTIVFTWATFSGLRRVSASGGTPQPLTALDSSASERSHAYPQFLPGGKNVLFSLWPAGAAVLSLETGSWRLVLPTAMGARYVPTGHLLFSEDPGYSSQAATLLAVPFDVERLEVTGVAQPVIEQIHFIARSGQASFTVARAGQLAYIPAREEKRWLTWVDRDGKNERITQEPFLYVDPHLSPDGRKVVFTNGEVQALDLERGTRTRQTMDGFTNNAIWDPNGEQIAYARAGESGHWNVFLKTVDSLAGNPKPLLRSDRSQFPESWSPDGTVLAFLEFNPETGTDIWLWSEEAGPRSFLATRFEEHNPEFSPDGDFIAYVSNESGRDEVYVRPYPTGERAWTISTDGGNNPLWSRDGRELFYRRGDAVIAVAVDRSHGFQPGASRTLFDGPYAHDFFRNYDIAPDGKRFLMVETDARPPTEVRLILDWFEELERLVPIGVPRAN